MHWYSILGILWLYIVLIKTVFSCLGEYWSYSGIFLEFYYCVFSWSRGYFHVLISIEAIKDFQQDLNWTWPLFGPVWFIIVIASVFFIMSIWEELFVFEPGIELWLWMNNVRLWLILVNGFGIFFDQLLFWIHFDITCFDWVLLWFYLMEIKLNMDICYAIDG